MSELRNPILKIILYKIQNDIIIKSHKWFICHKCTSQRIAQWADAECLSIIYQLPVHHMTSMDTVHQRSLIITVGGVLPGAASHNALNSQNNEQQTHALTHAGSSGARRWTSAANRLIGEVVQTRRRPLLGPSPGWKRLLALSHLRHY